MIYTTWFIPAGNNGKDETIVYHYIGANAIHKPPNVNHKVKTQV